MNSLLEPGGDLLISERGLDSSGNLIRLKPHPEFRLILTVDEKTAGGGVTVATCNNISRAMRNRGVELVLTRDVSAELLSARHRANYETCHLSKMHQFDGSESPHMCPFLSWGLEPVRFY